MSFLGKGVKRRAALFTAGALIAFQALAVIGANVASASGTCTYNLATKVVTVSLDTGTATALSVDATTKAITLNGVACGSATTANTTSISVLGVPSTNEQLIIDNLTGASFPSTISWAIDLGTGAADALVFVLGNQVNALTLSDTTFTMNGAAGVTAGVESLSAVGGNKADTIDASAVTSDMTVGLAVPGTSCAVPASTGICGNDGDDVISDGHGDDTVDGGAGDDSISQGAAANGTDVLAGGAGSDTVDYGARTTSTIIDATAVNSSGADANGDGDATDVGDEQDTLALFETFITGSGNDTLTGGAGAETFVPGDGDDTIDGGGGIDTLDYSTSSAAVTIDVVGGTVAGQGSDTFTNVEGFTGSDFADTLIWDATTPVAFSGGGDVDTVDASAETANVTINLACLTLTAVCPPALANADVENAFGGSGDDLLGGNILQNHLVGNDGNDTLTGLGGNDKLEGDAGNDNFTGGDGADTVTFINSPAGVTADMSLGFATGEGQDSLNDNIEIVVGSQFKDDLTGGQSVFGGSVNFRLKGKGGNDNLTGSNGNDTVNGGKGNDKIRTGKGDDTLKGGKGKDTGWGGSGTDICTSIEKQHSCEA